MSVVLLASCTLITSLDGLAGDAVVPNEAGLEADTSLPNEAGTTDAPNNPETGGPDAGFCANQPDAAFCDDFTRADTTDTKGDWGGTEAFGGPTIGIVDQALRIQVPQGTASGSTARLAHAFATTTHITYAYDLLLKTAPTDGTYQINNLALFPSTTSERTASFGLVTLYLRGDGFYVGTQTFPSGTPAAFKLIGITRQIPTGKLTRVVFEADVTAGQDPSLTVTFDGVQTYRGALDPFFSKGQWDVYAGVVYLQANTTYTDLRIDNAVVRIAP